MIRVSMGTNTNRVTRNADVNSTLRSVLDANGVDYSRGTLNLNGNTVTTGMMDQTFAALGIADGTTNYLLSVAKQDNA